MDLIFKLMISNQWLVYVIASFLATMMIVIMMLVLLSYKQGREVQFWPPKIGPKPSDNQRTDADHQSEISNRTGLLNYNRDSHALDSKINKIRSAKAEVWLIGATMHYTMGNCKSTIIERINSGLEFNLLLADPHGKSFEACARSFNQPIEALRIESEVTLAACAEIQKDVESGKGEFNVKLIDQVIPAGVYFFDPSMSDGQMFFVPHIPGCDAPVTPGFMFKNIPNGVLEDYYKLYKEIWRKCSPAQLSKPDPSKNGL